jgi:GNAT superfamily N-acetyltransferase
MNPLKDQTDLKAGLMHHGFSFYSRYPVMVYQFSDPTLEIVLNNFDVREISREMLFDWIVPLKEGFKSTETNALQYHDVHQRALQKKANFRHFVAYVDGKPVAAATLSLSEYGARLDDIATRPRFQRKGFARAVTLYALKVAKELGYLWVCLEASDQGIPLYTKMGFKRIYNNEVFENKNEITK